MKKICFISTVPITLKTFVLDTAKYLYKKENYKITFICNYDEKFAKDLPEYIEYIPVQMKRGIDFEGVLATKKMYQIFKNKKFDIVQYSTPNASLYASIASKFAKVPVRLYCQWGIRYVDMSGLKKLIFKNIEKYICKNSTDIRAVSMKNKEFAIKEKLYNKDKVKVNGKGGTIGVDLSKYKIEYKKIYRDEIRKKFKIDENDIVYGFIGRVSRSKGCTELFKAFLNINNENKNTKLLIVGPMDEIDIDSMLVKNIHINESIIFTGYIDSVDIVKYFSAIDIYVHPTYREGFGMALQEAAAMKNAIITTDIPGASEVMENGTSCLLVNPKDIVALQKSMTYLLKNETFRNELGENARIRVETFFDREKMIEIQKQDYKLLMEN